MAGFRVPPLFFVLALCAFLLVSSAGPSAPLGPELLLLDREESLSQAPANTAAPQNTPLPPSPPVSAEATPTPDPVFTISFAGDCTLGSDVENQDSANSFAAIVGDDFAYPFQNCLPYFENDDFTLVNFEGTLTNCDSAQEKLFRFKGDPKYAKALTAGFIEGVTLNNNHSKDYGEQGYEDTKAALEENGIAYSGYEGGLLYDTGRGLVIGVYGGSSSGLSEEKMQKGIAALYKQGAQFVVAALHFGDEGALEPNASQIQTAHMAIDLGARMVIGHHPHVLEPAVYYKGCPIVYSLGNFCFGGNRSPSDMDTVVVQQRLILKGSGEVELGETTFIPFRMSGYSLSERRNDFQPAPYMPNSEGYYSVFNKLRLSVDGRIMETEE